MPSGFTSCGFTSKPWYDGTNTFHVTQCAAKQNGPVLDVELEDLRPSKQTILNVPPVMDQLMPVDIVEIKAAHCSVNQLTKICTV